jgi:antirestriction protein ArdC
MPSQRKIREEITAKIIAALEKDLLPWRQTWAANSCGSHTNVISRKAYSGVNPLVLELHSAEHHLSSRWWATFRQWHDLGCFVKRRPDDVEPGKWGCMVVAFIPVTKEVVNEKTGEEEEEKYWILRKFTVFNAEQVEGTAAKEYQHTEMPDTKSNSKPDFEPAEELVQATGATIYFGGDRAFYRCPTPTGSWPNHTDGDWVQVPHKSDFVAGGYYPTLLHELAHWSEIRVGWERTEEKYAMGELIAEISACYLTNELGIPNAEPLENHAAYIQHWLQSMKSDPNFIFKATKQASKVSDFLLSFVRKPETTAALVETV